MIDGDAVQPAADGPEGRVPLTPLADLGDLRWSVISLAVVCGIVSVIGTYVIVAWGGPNSNCLPVGDNGLQQMHAAQLHLGILIGVVLLPFAILAVASRRACKPAMICGMAVALIPVCFLASHGAISDWHSGFCF